MGLLRRSSTCFMSSSFLSVLNERGQSTPALAHSWALRSAQIGRTLNPCVAVLRLRLQLVLGDDRAEVSLDNLKRLEHRPLC